MPRADEPRLTVRFSKVDFAMLEAAAVAGDVAVGALVREGALKFARELAGGSSAPARRMRRRSGAMLAAEDAAAALAAAMETPTPEPPLDAVPRGPVEIPKDGVERTAFFQRLSQRP